MTGNDTGIYIMLGGMVLFSTVIVVMDWFGRRQRRRQRNAVTATKH
jgi:hypothetical protein